MKRIPAIIVAILISTNLFGYKIGDNYHAGDKVNFSVIKQGKVIGKQNTECTGWNINGTDSLLGFKMETNTVYSRGGKTFDLEISNRVEYRPDGLPKKYEYVLNLLNAKVEHTGEFDGLQYSGTETRMGVKQPFVYKTKYWPVLFDNNFALEWELALKPLALKPGDSVAVDVLIPQLSQLTYIKVYPQPEEQFDYDGQSVPVRVYKIVPANQVFYIDHQGRLLKALDLAQQISIQRLAPGQEATIARKPFLSLLRDRVPGYTAILILAALWFVGFSYNALNRPFLYALLLLGVLFYWVSLVSLDPIQSLYFSFALDPANPTSSYIFLFGFALILAVVEELAKFIPILAGSFMNKSHDLRFALSFGAACGVGFGFLQASNLTSFANDGSLLMRSDLLQKFFLIGINAGTGALMAILITRRKPFAYYLIPIGIKTLFNWLIVFVQKDIMKPGFYTFMSFFFAALIVAIDLRLFSQFKGQKVKHSSKPE